MWRVLRIPVLRGPGAANCEGVGGVVAGVLATTGGTEVGFTAGVGGGADVGDGAARDVAIESVATAAAVAVSAVAVLPAVPSADNVATAAGES